MGNQIKGMGNDLVREARRRVGWTQARLAEAAGTTQSAIARLESGTTSPAFDDVLRLLRIMGLDLDFMLVERDDSDWIQAQRQATKSAPELSAELTQVAARLTRARRDFEREVA